MTVQIGSVLSQPCDTIQNVRSIHRVLRRKCLYIQSMAARSILRLPASWWKSIFYFSVNLPGISRRALLPGLCKCLEKQMAWLSRAEQCNVVWPVSPEQPFCESPPLLSSSRLSPSPWIPITVAVEGGLRTEEGQWRFILPSCISVCQLLKSIWGQAKPSDEDKK